MPKEIKIFRSQYWESTHKETWKPVEDYLIDQGYPVHQQVESCDIAFILCGLMENPNAFDNKVLFYNSMPHRGFHSMNISLRSGIVQTMTEYYDESFDLCGLSPQAAGSEIIRQHDARKS
jgi:hypothetical protein